MLPLVRRFWLMISISWNIQKRGLHDLQWWGLMIIMIWPPGVLSFYWIYPSISVIHFTFTKKPREAFPLLGSETWEVLLASVVEHVNLVVSDVKISHNDDRLLLVKFLNKISKSFIPLVDSPVQSHELPSWVRSVRVDQEEIIVLCCNDSAFLI